MNAVCQRESVELQTYWAGIFPKERKLQMLLLMSLLITRDENSEMMEEA